MEENPSLKIVILGNICVGKTCILNRFADNSFGDQYQPTIGLDYRVKQMLLSNKKTVKIQIWDTSGEERFLSLTKNFFKGANGALIVYDITNRKSFEDVERWVESIKENIDVKTLSIVIAANKVDMEKERVVSKEEGEKIASNEKFKFYETSAKSAVNINDIFQHMTEEMYMMRKGSSEGKEDNIKIKKKKKGSEKKKRKC